MLLLLKLILFQIIIKTNFIMMHAPRVWPTELAELRPQGKKASAPFSHDLGVVERALS